MRWKIKNKEQLVNQDDCGKRQLLASKDFQSASLSCEIKSSLNKPTVTPASTPDEAIWPNMFSAKKSCFSNIIIHWLYANVTTVNKNTHILYSAMIKMFCFLCL